jgi:hypothetical protein
MEAMEYVNAVEAKHKEIARLQHLLSCHMRYMTRLERIYQSRRNLHLPVDQVLKKMFDQVFVLPSIAIQMHIEASKPIPKFKTGRSGIIGEWQDEVETILKKLK